MNTVLERYIASDAISWQGTLYLTHHHGSTTTTTTTTTGGGGDSSRVR
jgi:hypothetical protein